MISKINFIPCTFLIGIVTAVIVRAEYSMFGQNVVPIRSSKEALINHMMV